MALDTPAVLVDVAAMDRNLRRFQDYCDRHGLKARPHSKTHKIPDLAKRQVALGAVGVTCQKIGEAEMMAAGGINDILLSYNLLGQGPVSRARDLASRCRLQVAADNEVVVDGLAEAFADQEPLGVLVECDTGAERCGVQSPTAAVDLAKRIAAAPGLRFDGLMTYPQPGTVQVVDAWLTEAVRDLRAEDLAPRTVSGGNSPDAFEAHKVSALTEHRAGTYIFNDRSLLERGGMKLEDCALRVCATVISRPTEQRAVLDAGSKTLSSDLFGCDGYGLIVGAPDAPIVKLSEEHAVVDLSRSDWQPRVGQRVEIVPNHACVVVNLTDTLYAVREHDVVERWPVVARGRVS